MALNRACLDRVFAAPEPFLVTRAAVRAFAAAIGDPNPLYHDPVAARAAGHPDLLVPPTFAALVAGEAYWQLLTDPEFGLPPEGTVHLAQWFGFERALRAGDELAAEAVPEAMDRQAGRDRVVFRTTIDDARGGRVATVRTTLLGPAPGPG
ncbi:MaoC family dehydratase N-terminal domain-containing protein [Kitasatospora sp. NPDC088351]|uniref:FAS1-like dehydratase domain-containing protein n=1 Tax=Kitasatospora sp. NPDC088351 TaxID=3155180 RepID=UPI0034301ECB